MSVMNKKNAIIIIFLLTISVFVLVYINKQRSIPNSNIDQTNVEEVKDNNTSNVETSTEKSLDPVSVTKFEQLKNQAHEFYKQGKYEEALLTIRKAMEIEKNDRVYMSLYGIQLALKNYPESEKAIKMSLALNPGIVSNWIEYASFERYYMKSSIENVSAVYEKALLVTKNDINIVINYASYMRDVGQKVKSIELWKKAIDMNPENKSVYQAEIDLLNK